MMESTIVRGNHRGGGQRGHSRGGRKRSKTLATKRDHVTLSPRTLNFRPALFQHAENVWGHAASTAEPFQSFEALHLERTYLLGSLQQQNQDATALLRKIAPLQERPLEEELPCVQRKTRKQIGWLKCRLDQTQKQEQSILARLGQISYEIQAKERWVQIENERRQQEFYQQQQFFNYQQGIRHGMQQMQSIGLNPAQQEFQPQGYFPPLNQIPQMGWQGWHQQAQGPDHGCETLDTATGHCAELAAERATESSGSGDVSPRCARGSVAVESPEKPVLALRSASIPTFMAPMSQLVHKRHSLSSLPVPGPSTNKWQFTADGLAAAERSDGEPDGGYLGFYVKP
ncbi:hypothetical protein LZ554_003239 [Drepanopeziza brunnea f. sp. 'monogermtubi']|nr:hypothetical protein LZ554_003239 [Drepanopeziza brunnea f. sp. 'monogermtubi']